MRKRWPAYLAGVAAVMLAILLPRHPSPTDDRSTIARYRSEYLLETIDAGDGKPRGR